MKKELVETLLQAIIEDGKAGINNAVQDKNLDNLQMESGKIEYAVRELLGIQEVELGGFNFYILGKMLCRSVPNSHSMKDRIETMISFYEDCLNKGLNATDGHEEGRTTFDFKEDEINELAKLMKE